MTNKALLIANGDYAEDSGLVALNGPAHDIDAMAKALTHRDYGLFVSANITRCSEYDRGRLLAEIRTFLKNTERTDFLLIYYSGHGIRESDRLYLAAKDTVKDLPATGVSSDDINVMLKGISKAERTVIILDCCHADAFNQNKGDGTGTLEKTFPGRWVVSSSSATKPSKDGDEGEPSKFTECLTEALVDRNLKTDDAQGYLDLYAVFRHIEGKLNPEPKINAAGGSIAIAKRLPAPSTSRRPAHPGFDRSAGEESVHRKVSMDAHDALVIRHLSTLLDLFDTQQNADHVGTIDTVRTFIAGLLWRNGMLQEVLSQMDASAASTRLTRLRLEIPDRGTELLPWEYLNPSNPSENAPATPLALRYNLAVERYVEPDKLRQPPTDGNTVDRVMVVGNPANDVLKNAQKAFDEDLAGYGIRVDRSTDPSRPPASGWGFTYQDMYYLQQTWAPVLVFMAAIRRSGDHQAVQLKISGPRGEAWIRAEDVCQFIANVTARNDKTPFRAIIIETFTTARGDDTQRATAELASSAAHRGLGNVIFLCHPVGFGYGLGDGQGTARTFTGRVIDMLNAGATVPRAFYAARMQMQMAYPERYEQTFGIPGLYVPKFDQSGPRSARRRDRLKLDMDRQAPGAGTQQRAADIREGSPSGLPRHGQQSSTADDESAWGER